MFISFCVIIFFSFKTLAQSDDISRCKCQYYSAYSIKMYKNKIDSICQDLNKNYGELIFIGSRSFSAANVLFITKKSGVYNGTFYNLIKGSRQIITGQKLSEIADRISKENNSIQDLTKIKPQYISHDFSFFISYNGGKDIYEVCYSQILAVKDKPIGKLFTFYLENFK
jgi:hypothetical protein